MAGLAVGVATALFAIAQAWLLASLVVEAWRTQTLAHPERMALLALCFVGRAGLAWLNQTLAVRSAASVKSQLRDDIVAARLRNPLEATSAAQQVTLLTKGLDALDGYFSKYLPQLGLAATVPLIVGVVILATDWISAAILAVTIPLIPLFMALIGWATQARMDRRWFVQQRLAQHFGDLIAGLPTLQAFGRASAQTRGLEQTEEQHRRETMGTLRWSFLSSFALEIISMLSVAVIAVGIGLRLVAGQLTLLPGLFVLLLAPEAYNPIRLVGTHYHDSADGVAAADAAFAAIDASPERGGTAAAPSPADAPVVVDAVDFRYPGTPVPVLDCFSLRLDPGEIVALSGASGGGKSTVLGLVLGFLAPDAGAVRVGDVALTDVDPASWRHHIAYVAQVPGMTHGTIADNVALGLPPEQRLSPDPKIIRDALERAGGAALDPARPVGDDGEGLSGGERRRVALARALVRMDHGASLLILDEPTAGLDAATEALAIDGIRALRDAGRPAGALVVSHRPAVLAAADRVVTLEAVSA